MAQTIEREVLPPIAAASPAPFLARMLCPVGPPLLERHRAGDAEVVSVPGRYGVTQLIVGPRSSVAVDVGSAADIPALAAVAGALGKPVALLVPSHLHFDHVLGLDAAAAAFSAPIAPPRLAAEAWRRGEAVRMPRVGQNARVFLVAWVWQGMPFLTAADRQVVRRFIFPKGAPPFTSPLAPALGEGDALPGCPGWTVLSTPGHADEAICLYHPGEGFLVTGDTVRNYLGGEYNPLLTDRSDYAATVARLKKLPVRAVFPGHGPAIVGDHILERLTPVP